AYVDPKLTLPTATHVVADSHDSPPSAKPSAPGPNSGENGSSAARLSVVVPSATWAWKARPPALVGYSPTIVQSPSRWQATAPAIPKVEVLVASALRGISIGMARCQVPWRRKTAIGLSMPVVEPCGGPLKLPIATQSVTSAHATAERFA